MAETAPVVPVVPVVPVAPVVPQAPARSQDEIMQTLVRQQEENDNMMQQLRDAQAKIQTFEAHQAAARKEQEEKAQQKLSGISKSLLEWCSANGMELTDNRVEKLSQLRKDHPATAEILFEIAHCASNKHRETQLQLNAQKKHTATAVLQQKVEQVFERRQNAAGPVSVSAAAPAAPAISTHVASANRFLQRKRKQSPSEAYGMQPNVDLIQALKQQRTSFSGHGTMVELVEDLKKRF